MNIKLDTMVKKQKIIGFGTSLSWWANIIGAWNMQEKSNREVREEICDLVFDKHKGLGMNIVRYHIAGGDNPEHNHILRKDSQIPTYKKTKASRYDWEADKNQLWVLEKAKELLQDDLIVEVFNISPPWWMTKSGCSCGNEDKRENNLKDECYEEFAEYVVDVTKHIHEDRGIKVSYLEPINEPEADYWEAFSPKQEGCHFSTGKSQDKVYNEVYKQLLKHNLHNDIKLTGVDETDIDMTIDEIKALAPETLNIISKINTHSYGGTKRRELNKLSSDLGKELWMSEYCTGYSEHSHTDMKAPLELSRTITKDLNELGAEAWIAWLILEDEHDSVIFNGSWGLIHGVYRNDRELENLDKEINRLIEADVEGICSYQAKNLPKYKEGDYFITKQYYIVAHYSRFIRPGYSIVETECDNVVTAISRDEKEVILVLTNYSNEEVKYHIDASAFGEFSEVNSFITNEFKDMEEMSVSINRLGVDMCIPRESIITTRIKK